MVVENVVEERVAVVMEEVDSVVVEMAEVKVVARVVVAMEVVAKVAVVMEEVAMAPLGADRSCVWLELSRHIIEKSQRRKTLMPDEQASLVLKYKELEGASNKARSMGLTRLREKQTIANRQEIEIEELTGIPSSTVCRHMKNKKGWNVASKSCKPHLTEENMQVRSEWAKKREKNEWKKHVDIDEKWFYVYSHCSKLKLPPGVEKHRTPIEPKDSLARSCVSLLFHFQHGAQQN
ncbi:MAG: hypothetical protein SGPRY_000434 [Prymnesium sp.]